MRRGDLGSPRRTFQEQQLNPVRLARAQARDPHLRDVLGRRHPAAEPPRAIDRGGANRFTENASSKRDNTVPCGDGQSVTVEKESHSTAICDAW
ncbi:hypothetical protein PSCLAVI8L_100185 [Pseudoclavibacter sp. 8L]|nr:hypothetical protein PSCLAVI8L_100185 [Pseudoclavibacter sp. 8L]